MDEDGLEGLKEALDRLPKHVRVPALRALIRLLDDDSVCLSEPPHRVRLKCRVTGRVIRAVLYMLESGGFSFDFYEVQYRSGGTGLVIGHIYPLRPAGFRRDVARAC
jgi:hypothetical protein